MSRLAEYLSQYIRRSVEGVLSGSSSMVQVRIIFRGPPEEILADVFDRLGGVAGLTVTVEGIPLNIPVFLAVDESDSPIGLSSGRCTDDHLVKIRTDRSCRFFVALVPPGVSINESVTTSSMYVGASIASDQSETAWMRDIFIDGLIKEAITRMQLSGQQSEAAVGLITQALGDASEIDVTRRDRQNEWELLSRLFELTAASTSKEDGILACIGFPPCDPKEFGSAGHVRIVRRIGEYLERGISPAFDSWIERAQESLRPALESAREFIRSSCNSASDFAKAPSCYYRLPMDVVISGQVPAWWRALTFAEWEVLLDSDGKPDVKSGLTVTGHGAVLSDIKGLPTVFQDQCSFNMLVDESIIPFPVQVKVSRSSGGRTFEVVDSFVITEGEGQWGDTSPPAHDRPLRYRFEVDGCKVVNVQAIALDTYGPAVLVHCRNGLRHSLFKRKPQKKGSKTAPELLECDLELPGIGSHHIDILHGRQVLISTKMVGHETDSSHDEIDTSRINRSGDTTAACLIETDEESVHEFEASLTSTGVHRSYRIYIRAADVQPIGVSSEFDRLILDHRSSTKKQAGGARVEPASCRAADLEHWILEDCESFRPLILGDDYLQAWTKPNWNDRPILSTVKPQHDPRPGSSEFTVPKDFRDARKQLQSLLRDGKENAENLIEAISLGDLMREDDFRTAICQLLDSYGRWLKNDYEGASWADVIAVTRRDSTNTTLETYPHALLLSPLHPLRLGWQCVAQGLLQHAIDARRRCPAASVLDPRNSPDCLLLPCRTPTGKRESKLFLSVASSSDYWGVLWSGSKLDDLNEGRSTSIFDDRLGITIDGLALGFSVAQVERAISEISRIASAKPTIRISVTSDTHGSSSCNQGIFSWGRANLGEQDTWSESGARMLEVHDLRSDDLQPEDAVLSTLTQEVGATMKWFSQRAASSSSFDLAIVAHLGTQNPELSIQGIRTPLDALGLNRMRVRRQLGASSGRFIAESRVGKHDASTAVVESLPETVRAAAGYLASVCAIVEDSCSPLFDSYVFAPKMPTLDNALATSRYCAVSSTNVDPSCFFGAGERSYLWDYDLPSYSRRAGENSGFYLIASESPTILQAARGAIKVLKKDCPEINDELIGGLLREISRRGVPTLKRLTSGGGTSLGEIGVLSCLRVLQSEFSQVGGWYGVFPTIQQDERLINVVVPVDPFRAYFDELRDALGSHAFLRPDLLAISIRIGQSGAEAMQVTPIEVKARSATMGDGQIKEAISQATAFADFLNLLFSTAAEHPIWGIACRHLVGSWLDYSFRVYGQLESLMNHANWNEWHSTVLSAVLSGNLIPTVDTRGRLFVVDASSSSKHRDIDGDGFNEVVVMSHADAFSILTSPDSSIMPQLARSLAGWELSATKEILETPGGAAREVTPSVPSESQKAVPKSSKVEIDDTASTPRHVQEVITAGPVHDAAFGVRFPVGCTVDDFDPRQVYFQPSNTKLNQLNIGIVGDLGVGKTQLIQSLLYQLRSQPAENRGRTPAILILDYKKDYSKPAFVAATNARVVRPENMPLNLFDVRDSAGALKPWLQRARCFIDILSRIYPGIGPVQQERLKNAVKQSFEESSKRGCGSPTIYDVFESYARIVGDKADAPYGIMSYMVDMELFTRDHASVLPFSAFFDGVVVVDLGSLEDDDKTKNMLVAIFLNLFYAYMLRVEKKPFIGSDPQLRFIDSFLLVDEANNIMQYEFDVLKKLLLQGREFGIGVVLASQYLSHFRTPSEDYREPLLTWFVHKVPNLTVRDLEGIGLTAVDQSTVDRIKALPNHNCFYKSFDIPGETIRATPFYELL